MGTGLASDSALAARTRPDAERSDPAAVRIAGRLNDLSLGRQGLRYDGARSLGAMPTERLRAQLRDALRACEFTPGYDKPPDFSVPFKPGSPTPPVSGTLIAERALTVDEGRKNAAWRRVKLLLAIGGILIAGGAVGAVAVSPGIGSLILLGFILLVVALFSYVGTGVFDSDVLFVEYTARLPPTVTFRPPDANTPMTYDVVVASGRIVSTNWANRNSSGRSFSGYLPGHEELAAVPSQFLDRIPEGTPLT